MTPQELTKAHLARQNAKARRIGIAIAVVLLGALSIVPLFLFRASSTAPKGAGASYSQLREYTRHIQRGTETTPQAQALREGVTETLSHTGYLWYGLAEESGLCFAVQIEPFLPVPKEASPEFCE